MSCRTRALSCLQNNLPAALVGSAFVATALAYYLFDRQNRNGEDDVNTEEESVTKGGGEVREEAFLNRQVQRVELQQVVQMSRDTKLFRFSLDGPRRRLGLPTGKHITLFAPNTAGIEPGKWNGRDDPEAKSEQIQRKYTPTSSDHDLGHVDFVIKVYSRGEVDRFPDGGKMSQYLDALRPGDRVALSGPWGLIEYKGRGAFKVKGRVMVKRRIGMIAGGTGITPMLQVIKAILRDPSDRTEVSLIYANQTEDDILVRAMLEEQLAIHSDRFKLWYTVDRAPEGAKWAYDVGFVNEDMIRTHLPAASSDSAVFMCGPPPMIKYACLPNLEKLGFDLKDLICF